MKMNRCPNNNHFRPRISFRPQSRFQDRPRFQNRPGNNNPSAPGSTGSGRGYTSYSYEPKAVYNYRTAQSATPNRFLAPRYNGPNIRPHRGTPSFQGDQFQQKLISKDYALDHQHQGTQNSQHLAQGDSIGKHTNKEDNKSVEQTDPDTNSDLTEIRASTQTHQDLEQTSHTEGEGFSAKSQGPELKQQQTCVKEDSNTNNENTKTSSRSPSDLPKDVDARHNYHTEASSKQNCKAKDLNKPETSSEVGHTEEENKSPVKDRGKGREEDNSDDDSSDDDTSYCKYCKLRFASSVSYFSHTRGMIHINLYMAAKVAKDKLKSPMDTVKADTGKGNVQIHEPTEVTESGQFFKSSTSVASNNQHKEQEEKMTGTSQVGEMKEADAEQKQEILMQPGQMDSFFWENKKKNWGITGQMNLEGEEMKKSLPGGLNPTEIQIGANVTNLEQNSNSFYKKSSKTSENSTKQSQGQFGVAVEQGRGQFGTVSQVYGYEENEEDIYDPARESHIDDSDSLTPYNDNYNDYPEMTDVGMSDETVDYNRKGQFYDYDSSGSYTEKRNQNYSDFKQSNYSSYRNKDVSDSSQSYHWDKYSNERQCYRSTGQFGIVSRSEYDVEDKAYENKVQYYNKEEEETQNKQNDMENKNADKEIEEDDGQDEDTSYCKYCKLSFKSSVAYHTHTRGLQHTTLIMEEKQKKGDPNFRKEMVNPEVLKIDIPKPVVVQPEKTEDEIPDDYDFETNWMNLDNDLVKKLKQKKKASERDLTPDEIGKKQFSEDLTCAICNVRCTSALTFKMHVDGKTHKNNLEALESGNKYKLKQKKSGSTPTVFASVDSEDVQSRFSLLADNYTESALIGLEFITEFQKPDPKAACRYVCNLCEAKCDSSTILPHVIGVKHRLHYFKEKHHETYLHLTKYTSKKKKSEMNSNAEDFAKQVEEREGRKQETALTEVLFEMGIKFYNRGKLFHYDDLAFGRYQESHSVLEVIPVPSQERHFLLCNYPLSSTRKDTFHFVKVKIELEAGSGEGDLNEIMTRMSRALKQKMHDLERGKDQKNEDSAREFGGNQNPQSGLPMEGRGRGSLLKETDELQPSAGYPPAGKRSFPRDLPQDFTRGPLAGRRPSPRAPYGPPRDPYGPARDYYGPESDPYGHERDFYASPKDPYGVPRDPYRVPAFCDDPLFESGRRTRDVSEYEDESHRLDLMLEQDRLRDPYQEQRRLDDIYFQQQRLREMENRRLDDLMLERHKLQDPLLETRRLEDILERKRKIAEAEKLRLDDIMHRKRLLEENDPDRLRLERYEKLRKTMRGHDVTAARQMDRPSKEELIARRRALCSSSGQESRPLADKSLLPSSFTGTTSVPSSLAQTASSSFPPQSVPESQLGPSSQYGPSQPAPAPAGQSSTSAENTARQVAANKELQEELAKNPGVNIGELLSNLSASMIATEDDAAMALQISNALTQALLKFRLQHAAKQLAKTESSKPLEPKSIPGLGSSTTDSGKSVPSFLRTSANNANASPASSETSLTVIESFSLKSDKLQPAPSLPQACTKTSATGSSSFSLASKDTKKAKSAVPESSVPETYLLKSIRQKAKKLQAQLATKGLTTNIQPGIQAQNQFVHGQNQNTDHLETTKTMENQVHSTGFEYTSNSQTSVASSVSVPGYTSTSSNTFQSPVSDIGYTGITLIPASGIAPAPVQSSAAQFPVTVDFPSTSVQYPGTNHYPFVVDSTAYYSQPGVSSAGGNLTYMNPAYYTHWYNSVYRTDIPQPAVPQPVSTESQPPPPPPPPPPPSS